MRRIAEAAGRVLRPLSSLLNTRLRLESGIAADENQSTVAISGSNLVVRAADNRPFTDRERDFLREVFDLIRLSEETDARLRAPCHRGRPARDPYGPDHQDGRSPCGRRARYRNGPHS